MNFNSDIIYFFINLAIFFLILIWVRRRRNVSRKKKDQLKSFRSGGRIFLCEGADYLGDNLLQLYGEPSGTSIRPGMKIAGPDGREYNIKEVYADDQTPDKPDPEITVGMENTAIVIGIKNGDRKIFRQSLKANGVIALEVREIS